MKRSALLALAVVVLVLATTAAYAADPATGYTLVGWNNLGMHCMDADFQVFTILPPYNVIHAQLIDANGHFVTNGASYVVTYQAVADPKGSVNSSSVGKTNFWQFVGPLFGATPAPDMGLAGYGMPGPGNVPQNMSYDPGMRWWIADGIPITPVNDKGAKDTYPMMRLVARDLSGRFLAQTDIVLPVSDEMDCRACHASGSGPDARPSGGWINHADPQLDFRYNVLLLHDDYQGGSPRFQQALADAGYDPAGLYATAHDRGTPILCAKCHASNALPGTGMTGIPPLTQAVHSMHASVNDPTNQMALDDSTNRSACYRCHPGSTTRCLRGAMGKAVAGDGTMAMQCQGCHGSMSAVGSASRVGWLDQPSCQNCHTGTAVRNNGQIRYSNALEANGSRRQAVDATFATNPDVPGVGYSLYRFSFGHGGLACEACHGATHAEYASFEANDNVQSQQLQGHAGTISDCSTCHAVTPSGSSGGPHGMHPVGQAWVEEHGDAAEDGGSAACQRCHGSDSRGTVLSYALGPRTLNTEFGTKTFWQGFQISCYACHNGPNSENSNPNRAPVASDLNRNAKPDSATPITLHRHRRGRQRADLPSRLPAAARHGRPVRERRDLLRRRRLQGRRQLHLRRLGRDDQLQPGEDLARRERRAAAVTPRRPLEPHRQVRCHRQRLEPEDLRRPALEGQREQRDGLRRRALPGPALHQLRADRHHRREHDHLPRRHDRVAHLLPLPRQGPQRGRRLEVQQLRLGDDAVARRMPGRIASRGTERPARGGPGRAAARPRRRRGRERLGPAVSRAARPARPWGSSRRP